MKRIVLVLILFSFFFCFFDIFVIAEQRGELFYESMRTTSAAKRITINEAYKIYESGKARLISVDTPDYFKHRHIVGSLNMPYAELEKALEEGRLNFSKDQIILLYCR